MFRLLAALLLIPTAAYACDCPPTPTCGAITTNAQFFVGTAIAQRNVPHQGAHQVDFVDYTVHVTESFAPNISIGSITHVWSDPSSGCSWTFKVGQAYLFETHPDQGRLYTSLCTFTAELWNAQPVLVQLRALKASHRPPSLVGTLFEEGVHTPSATRPLASISITAHSATGQTFTTKTDAQGVFLFNTLPTGAYTLTPTLPADLKFDRAAKGAEDPSHIQIPATTTAIEASCRAYLDATKR